VPDRDSQEIVFSESDLEVFSAASGDRNALHLSETYARATPAGQRVVFGCLGAAACLTRIALPADRAIAWIEVKCLRPIFLGVPYRIESSWLDGDDVNARLLDGSLPVLSIRVRAPRGEAAPSQIPAAGAHFDHAEPVNWLRDQIQPGLEVSGLYAGDPAAFKALTTRWCNADPFALWIFCCLSYLIGMELPGEGALLSTFNLDFDPVAPCFGEVAYRLFVRSVDRRLHRIEVGISLAVAGRIAASGNCSSYISSPLPDTPVAVLTAPRTRTLEGRIAVIAGSSRGLGAAVQRALDLRGAAVYSLSRSGDPSGGPNDQRAQAGDATDPAALQCLRDRVLAEQNRVDILICNASPPLLPLRLEPNGFHRIADYLNHAMALTLAPLCAFLEVLNEHHGIAVIVSSRAVESPAAEWPHYLAAKQASEMLARVASLQYPHVATVILRPGKMLTALTNTPLGRLDAQPPELVAERLAECLEHPLTPGETTFLEC
jgi:NAD(P)-dependent dehydrogenase (short-subunit alcohol dehydrogenase family)/acyl dehydratase